MERNTTRIEDKMNLILHSRMKKRALNMKPIYLCEKCKDTGLSENSPDPLNMDYCDCNTGANLMNQIIK